MKRLLSPILPTKKNAIELSSEEAHHALQVLRLKNEETVELIDGEGNAILGKIRIYGKKASIEYSSPSSNLLARNQLLPITLGLGILKTEAMEWVIEKSVELGVERFVPLIVEHSVVDTHKKGGEFFRERWQKLADQALKQCGRLKRLRIDSPIKLTEFLNSKIASPQSQRDETFIWCDEQASPKTTLFSKAILPLVRPTRLTLFIGPEGGWSKNERLLLEKFSTPGNNAFIPVTLGSTIFRAETAALYTVSVLHGAWWI